MNNSNTDSSQSKEYYVVCPILTVQGSGDGWARKYAGPMLTALHAGIAWRFKLLSLRSCWPPPPCTTPPSSLSTSQSGNSYNFPLWKACQKFMARNKRAFGDCCFNQHETCNQSGTHSLQLGIGLHLKVVVLIHNVVVLKERSTPAYLDGALQKCCGVVSHKPWTCELLSCLLVVAVVGRQYVVSSVVVQVVVGVVHHHIADVNNISPVSRCVVEDVVLLTEWNKKFGLL